MHAPSPLFFQRLIPTPYLPSSMCLIPLVCGVAPAPKPDAYTHAEKATRQA